MKKTSIITICFIFMLLLRGNANSMDIIRVVPAPDSTVESVKPTLYVYYSASENEKIDLDKVKLWLNGNSVTWKCLVMQNCISCDTSFRFPQGKNTIRFLYDSEKPSEYTWSFNVKTRDEIKSDSKGIFTHNYEEPLQEGDAFEVKLVSEPGGKAVFNIGSWKKDISMKETSPGVYEGKYIVERYDNVKDQPITAAVSIKSKGLLQYESDKRISISAYFFKVKIISPKSDTKVEPYFDIIGRTRPKALVSVAPNTGFSGGIGADTGGSSTQGAIEVMADEKGYFTIHYGFPIKLPGMKHRFFVIATDNEGNKSFPITFSVQVK